MRQSVEPTAGPREVLAQSSAWEDCVLPACAGVVRLRADHPPSGLLWLLSGEVRLSMRGRERILRKGDIVAYRLGDSLRWSSAPDTRVRWSARPVRLGTGTAQAWTADLATRLPAVSGRKVRRARAIAAVAACVLGSVLVSAIYAARHETDQRHAAQAGAVGPQTDEQARILDGIRVEARRQGFAVGHAFAGFQGLYQADVHAVLGSDEEAADALAPLAEAILGLSPEIRQVCLRLMAPADADGHPEPRLWFRVPSTR